MHILNLNFKNKKIEYTFLNLSNHTNLLGFKSNYVFTNRIWFELGVKKIKQLESLKASYDGLGLWLDWWALAKQEIVSLHHSFEFRVIHNFSCCLMRRPTNIWEFCWSERTKTSTDLKPGFLVYYWWFFKVFFI